MENRAIKFRAWNPKTKNMLNPDYSDWEDFFVEPDGTISHTYENGGPYHSFRDRKKLDLILMQFVGLTDKNGKEIYEGDIIKTHTTVNYGFAGIQEQEITGVVKYEIQGAVYHIGFTDRNGKSRYLELRCTYGDGETYQADHFEIIGDIYTNPDLLK